EQAQPRRQKCQRQRQLPEMIAGIDHEGIDDPVQPDQELAEGERPAGAGGGAPAAGRVRRAVQQQRQARKAKQQRRKKFDGCERGGGKSAQREGATQTAPTAKTAQRRRQPRQHVHVTMSARGGRMRRRRIRRGSASSTSNVKPEGPSTISPRCGTRPRCVTTSPPSVSISSSSSGGVRSKPVSSAKS